MPATTIEPLPKKTRVKVTIGLDGVPEGTAGTVRGTVGLSLPRHRVEFDNGHFVTSVARPNLVLEDEWDDFVAERERAAEAAEEEAAAPAASSEPAAAGDDAGPADDRLAALLAKSKAAREKKATDS